LSFHSSNSSGDRYVTWIRFRVFHTRPSRQTESNGVLAICTAMGDVQPCQRAIGLSKPYNPLKRPFNLFAWVATCG
jgi:hypothetical protein